MDKTDCYKCDKEPSAECGECAVWLAHEEVSEKERNAYKQGVKEGYSAAVDDITDLFCAIVLKRRDE